MGLYKRRISGYLKSASAQKRFRPVFFQSASAYKRRRTVFSSQPALICTPERFFFILAEIKGCHFSKVEPARRLFFTLFSTGFFAVVFSSAKKKVGIHQNYYRFFFIPPSMRRRTKSSGRPEVRLTSCQRPLLGLYYSTRVSGIRTVSSGRLTRRNERYAYQICQQHPLAYERDLLARNCVCTRP